jgi:hypothetical protein
MCKLLNVGHGDMQVTTDSHRSRCIELEEALEAEEHLMDPDTRRFYRLFQESTFGTSRAAAIEMTNMVNGESKNYQEFLLFNCLYRLIRSDTKMLSWPNSPLLVLLQFVDPSCLSGTEETKETPLHHLATLLHHSIYSTHVNQLILAKQLIEHGANVNAVSTPNSTTPLHCACFSGNVTNLDFIELLLEEGSDPNAQHHLGITPMMTTTKLAPSAAKFMVNWPTTDVHIIPLDGESFLVKVRSAVRALSFTTTFSSLNPDQVQHLFLLQQWRDVEETLVGRIARDAGIEEDAEIEENTTI